MALPIGRLLFRQHRVMQPLLSLIMQSKFEIVQCQHYRMMIANQRNFHRSSGPLRNGEYEMKDPESPDEIVNIVYIDRDGDQIPVQGKIGDNVMYLSHRHGVEIEGACEASLACCTCHVILDEEYFDKLPEIEEEEEDMLDLAPFLTSTSRLSCQIKLTKDLEGMVVKLPKATRNFYVDGHVPEPH
ncbi:adrenodoxin-like protein 1, mitochondrial [Anneissia japonica]|uniref:adrenodoxin-like protein 1, mitochondrial n=1 Tax=Anneissia japonica TaxID=1529436 RepID=UPI00142567D4|nr:adrenodoxin-like protein 1, mitochondrial [Anneissia japonica]